MLKKLALLLICLVTSGFSQSLADFISGFSENYCEGYLQPLAKSLGADLNNGIYRKASIPLAGFNVRLELRSMVALVSDDERYFQATTAGFFQPVTTVEAPTIFGPTTPVSVDGDGGTQYGFSGGYDVGMFPTVMPQLTVGSFFGTEATLRYFKSETEGSTFDKISIFGIGVRHSISQYFPLMPVNLAVHYFQQHYELTDVITADGLSLGLQSSIPAGKIVDFYAGLAYETFSMNISYDYDGGESMDKISLDLESDNKFRFLLGASLDLPILSINADYSFAPMKSYSLGISFGN